MTSQEIQDYFWEWCINHGLPETSTAGCMGNVSAESSWNPDQIEEGNSIGFGLFQWSFGRRTQLEAFGTDLEHQMFFFWSELTGQYPETGADYQWINLKGYKHDVFMAGKYNPKDSASAFCWCWERPNENLAHEEYRRTEAQKFYDKYTGSIEPPIDPPIDPPDPPDPITGKVYRKLIKTSYNLNQLDSNQLKFIKKLKFGDKCYIKFMYTRRKNDIGYGYTKKRLTIDNDRYIIKDVENNGFFKLITSSGNICYKFVNPKYIMEVTRK